MLRALRERLREAGLLPDNGPSGPAAGSLIGDAATFDRVSEGWRRAEEQRLEPMVEVDPRIVHLAAFFDGFSDDRWQVLAESETPNGWPRVWSRWYQRPSQDWDSFKEMALEARLDREKGIPYTNSLIWHEWEQMPPDESFMAPPPPCLAD